jgi:heterotetrameric sarcosine oxidase delta subunit
MQIVCPWCGPRERREFLFGGTAGLPQPDSATVSDAQWTHYLFVLERPALVQSERWQHLYGCREWFVTGRDLITQLAIPLSQSALPLSGNTEARRAGLPSA